MGIWCRKYQIHPVLQRRIFLPCKMEAQAPSLLFQETEKESSLQDTTEARGLNRRNRWFQKGIVKLGLSWPRPAQLLAGVGVSVAS